MSNLINELRTGIVRLVPGKEPGEFIHTTEPPNALMLRAANELFKQTLVKTGLENALNTALKQIQELECLQSTQKSMESLEAGPAATQTELF